MDGKNLTFWKRKFTIDETLVFQYDPEAAFNGTGEHLQGNVKTGEHLQGNVITGEHLQGNVTTKCQSNSHLLFLQRMYYKPVLPKVIHTSF